MNNRENDKILYAMMIVDEIRRYVDNSEVSLTPKMKFHLEQMLYKCLIMEMTFKHIVDSTDKAVKRAVNRLIKLEGSVSYAERGEEVNISLTQPDITLITTLDAIVFDYQNTLKVSSNMNSLIKMCMRSIVFDYLQFQDHILQLGE